MRPRSAAAAGIRRRRRRVGGMGSSAVLAVLVLAVLLLAACSAAGSGGTRPTLAGSATLPASGVRSPAATDRASPTASAPAPTASAPVTSAPTTSAPTTSSAGGGAADSTTRTATTTTTAASTTTATTTTTTQTTTRTATVTQSVPASPAATSPAPAAGTSPEQQSGAVPWWAWLLLAVGVAGAVVLAVVLAGRARRARAWDDRLSEAERSARWLQDRAFPAVLAEPDAEGAAAVWATVRRSFLELDDSLAVLAGEAPDQQRRAMAASLRVALVDVAAALDDRARAATAPGKSAATLRVDLARETLERRLRHEAPVQATDVPPGTTPTARVPRPAPPGDSSPGEPGTGGGRHAQPHD